MIKSVAFYPEYVGQDRLRENFVKIRDGGIQAVRFGEFAWGYIEPREGEFVFDIFDAAFDMAEELGLKIIFGTPTACPPAWLCAEHPDILPVNEKGVRVGFGARQHRCYNAPSYRAACTRITRAIAKRYGERPGLWGWQIDNELAAEQKYCYCDHCKRSFQGFLKDKYQTIENLNRRWMTTFWGQDYAGFHQVPLPVRLEASLPMRPHPSLLYEFLRFSSASVVEFTHGQADVIRAFSSRPVTTNQDDFYYGDNVNVYDLYSKLDLAAFDVYTHKHYEAAYYADMFRNIKDDNRFAIMEYGCDSPILTDVLDLLYARGCELAGLFKFNPFPAGHEQGPYGLVDHFGHEMPWYAAFRDWTPKASPAPGRRVSLLYDFDSSYAYNAKEYRAWEDEWGRIFSRLVYREYVIHTLYKRLFDEGVAVDIIPDAKNADPANPLYVPMHLVYKERTDEALIAFAEAGGRIIATNDLFVRDEYNAYMQTYPRLHTLLSVTLPAPEGEYKLGKGTVCFCTSESGYDGVVI